MQIDLKTANRGPEASCSGRNAQSLTRRVHKSPCDWRSSSFRDRKLPNKRYLRAKFKKLGAVLETEFAELINSTVRTSTPLNEEVLDAQGGLQGRSAAEALDGALRDGCTSSFAS